MSATPELDHDRSTDTTISPVPDDLASSNAKLVYLYLATADGATVEDLHESLGLKNITLYPVLDSLDGRGLVERDGRTYRPAAA